MKKSILNLGAQELSKNEQKNIKGALKYVKDPMCICFNINYGVYNSGGGVTPVANATKEQIENGTVIPIGFIEIQPKPACCL